LVTASGIVAVHGGVPKEKDINLQLLRDNKNIFHQILWNDPSPDIDEFEYSQRGGGIFKFGRSAFDRFMHQIGATIMVRSHQVLQNGYELLFDNRLATIFSNGRPSRESRYQEVNPKFMVLSLGESIPTIDPAEHIISTV
jgi:hypothetical protein